MTYFVQQEIQVTASVRDVSGALIDPASVTAELRDPTGFRSPMTVTKDSTGVYHFTFVASTGGTYWYRWDTNGGVETAFESSITVSETKFP